MTRDDEYTAAVVAEWPETAPLLAWADHLDETGRCDLALTARWCVATGVLPHRYGGLRGEVFFEWRSEQFPVFFLKFTDDEPDFCLNRSWGHHESLVECLGRLNKGRAAFRAFLGCRC